MKSVWYEMGMRDGVFRGVIPERFLNTAYRFFLDLKGQCCKGIDPDYKLPEAENNFSFAASSKYGWKLKSNFSYEQLYGRLFTFHGDILFGAPVPEEVWNAEKPEWKKTRYTEEELLGEKIIPHPLTLYPREARYSLNTDWEYQRYRLIQKMRYCLIPLKMYFARSSGYHLEFHEFFWQGGYIDDPGFWWDQFPQIKVQIPEYWTKEGTAYKIGIFAKNLTHYDVPFDGCFWIHDREFISQKPTVYPYWGGAISELRIYGIADISTHPDFSRYFHISSTQNKED